MIIEWDDSLSVNSPDIDEQHKMLISMIQSLQKTSDKAHTSKCLDDLIDYAGFHFTDEELFMQNNNYPDLENHKLIHGKFVQKISDMIKGFEKGVVQPQDLLTFLIDWLINHIKKVDRLYAIEK